MLYNLTDLCDLTDGDTALLKSVLHQFIVDVTVATDNLKGALKTKDFSTIKFNVHKLKPALSTLKIDKTENIVFLIEHKAASNMLDDVLINSISDLDAILQSVIISLKAEFEI